MSEMKYDQEGFIQLIHKQSVPKEPEKEKKSKKNAKNPFKKGSWKHAMLKVLKKWKSSKYIVGFHFVKTENLLVYRNDKAKIKISNVPFSKEKLLKINEKYDDAYVLINASEGVFIRISIPCYLKFSEVDKIQINVDIKGQEDGDDEWFDMYTDTMTIDNINQLMDFINYYRQMVKGCMEVQAHCCWYTYVKYKVKTVILKQDGTAEAYKGDFNEFLAEYEFDPLL